MIETGTFLQQRYRIDRQIGQGGMGAVYIAKDERFDSTVAIKETLCFSDENFRKAIEREARLLNSLKHSALPRVSDHFEEQNGQFLVMEYIPGEDVAAMLESSGKPFPVDQVLKWADQLLDALDYLHNQEMPVIHRDIKPQNLKINSRGEAILLDFGLAKGNPTDAGHLTAAKSIFGYSRNYASLEQIQGTGTDPRSDLYSLGATLYHMLTGRAPEDALTRAMSVLSKKDDPLVPASIVNPDISGGVAGVLQKALDLDAGERPSSAAEMREMLHDHQKYAYLADTVTEVVNLTDHHISSQPTRLMSEKTRAAGGPLTGVATEVIPPTSSQLSLLTSVGSSGQADKAGNQTTHSIAEIGASKRSKSVFAAAMSLVLVVGAVAGIIYVADPTVFGYAEDSERQTTVPDSDTRSPADANTSSIDLDQNFEPGQVAAPVVSERPNTAANRPAQSASKNGKTAGNPKKPDENQAGVLDIEVDDPDIPKGGVVLTDRDANGKVTVMRVMPKVPKPPDQGQNIDRRFDPFPNGFDFRSLTPAQQRKLQQLRRQKLRTQMDPPPPAKPKPSP